MTTREKLLAETHICYGMCQDDIRRDYTHCTTCIRLDYFLMGLRVGKLKWHQVTDGDLPPPLTHVLNEKGNKVMYNAKEHVWQEYSDYYEDYVETEQPIAWCEVPIFEEAEADE